MALKCRDKELLLQLHTLVCLIWKFESIPGEATVVNIFKKGNKSDCGNYRGISLLLTVGKVIAKVLLNCLLPVAEELLLESQYGFQPQRGTTDMILTVRQLQEKCREKNLHMYMAFFDLTKAFDAVNQEALWSILLHFGCSMIFVTILHLLHDDMEVVGMTNSSTTDSFPSVKQGCVIAPTLQSEPPIIK
eukprot:g39852.t1